LASTGRDLSVFALLLLLREALSEGFRPSPMGSSDLSRVLGLRLRPLGRP
jgi:hypothetical protein